VQLIRAEDRFREHCESYHEAYYSAMKFVNNEFSFFLRSTCLANYSGSMSIGTFVNRYREFARINSSTTRESKINALFDRISKLSQIVNMPSSDVYFIIREYEVWSIYFESEEFMSDIRHDYS